MCPWEKTAVFSRWSVHRRVSAWSLVAVNCEPVSTMKRPSSVVKTALLAKVGTKATPWAISHSSPLKTTGWWLAVLVSPRHKRSARSSRSTGLRVGFGGLRLGGVGGGLGRVLCLRRLQALFELGLGRA